MLKKIVKNNASVLKDDASPEERLNEKNGKRLSRWRRNKYGSKQVQQAVELKRRECDIPCPENDEDPKNTFEKKDHTPNILSAATSVTATESSLSSTFTNSTSMHRSKGSLTNPGGNNNPIGTKKQWSNLSEMYIFHNSVLPMKSRKSLQEMLSSASVTRSRTQCSIENSVAGSSDSMTQQTKYMLEERWLSLIDDPTVEESIECVFSHQVDEGGVNGDVEKRDDINNLSRKSHKIQSEKSYQDEEEIELAVSSSSLFCHLFDNNTWDSTETKSNSSLIHTTGTSCSKEIQGGLGKPNSVISNNLMLKESDLDVSAMKPLPENDLGYQNYTYPTGDLVCVGNVIPSILQEEEDEEHHLGKTVHTEGPAFSLDDADSFDAECFVSEKKVKRGCCISCLEKKTTFPHLPPESWPQFPLLLRPSPGSGTRVRGVRFSGSKDYLWSYSDYTKNCKFTWWNKLSEIWNTSLKENENIHNKNMFCPECCCIPINNGNEPNGKALVVDFESPLFIGTLLLRVKRSNGTTPSPYDNSFGYFNGLNRQYQAVVRGRFKKEGIPMTECVTGQIFERSFRKIPPKIVCRGGIKVLSFFAPRLNAKIEGPRPMVLSPLGSTPQTVVASKLSEDKQNSEHADAFQAEKNLENPQVEPTDNTKRLISISELKSSSSSTARAKARKKAFDILCAKNKKTPTFQCDTVYTFEFLQHLVDFTSFEVNLGSVLGKVRLKDMLDGQPLKFMGAHQRPLCHDGQMNVGKSVLDKSVLDIIWSFELWHEGLIENRR